MDKAIIAGKTALLFAGQGAQYSGMGRDLYEHNEIAWQVFMAAEKLCPGIRDICFQGTDAELRQTANAQPAIFVVGMAAAMVLKAQGFHADMLAGFSLGELAALVFAESLSFSEGFKLVCERGRLMQKAGEENPSAMVAVLKLDHKTVEAICQDFEQVYPVNYNGPGQLTVAGRADEMEKFALAVRQAGGRAKPLAVSGGFHCPFMAQAATSFKEALASTGAKPPRLPVYANCTAQPYTGDIEELLARQIISPVRWQNSIENMLAAGAETFVEVGPGHALSNMVTKIAPEAHVYHVEDRESLQKTLEGLMIC